MKIFVILEFNLNQVIIDNYKNNIKSILVFSTNAFKEKNKGYN